MKVTFLGTGTSHGVPMIGCDCPVCTSDDPKNRRTRSSVLIEADGANLLIDTTPEFRVQVLRENVRRIDAVLFTHAHADHIFGLDDVRRFNDLNGKPMPCYGSADTIRTIRRVFEYVFVPTQRGGGKPSLDLIEVDAPFTLSLSKGSPSPNSPVASPNSPVLSLSKGALDGPILNPITPIPILHGAIPILGYRIGDFAYITDCSEIPDSSLDLLRNLDTLVLGALRHEPHETHFSLSEGLAVVEQLQPRRALFTHIAHRLDHEPTNRSLPANAQLAYDGLRLVL